MGKIRNYFASANTCNGFINLFNNINMESNSFLYIIKGGSGTGKSTLMKKIGNHFSKMGNSVEYFFCSSDSSSLDGVRVADYNIAIVDGTAPHITNDSLPQIRDKIINIGEYISQDIFNHKERIESILVKKSKIYKAIYQRLKIAGDLYQLNNIILNEPKSLEVTKKTNEIIALLSLPNKNSAGKTRELFLNILNFNNSNFEEKNGYRYILSFNGTQKFNEKVLDKVSKKIIDLGYSVINFKNILNPNGISAIEIAEENILIKANNIESNKSVLKNNRLISDYLNNAKSNLKSAFNLHKKLERFYIESTDFNGINLLTENLIKDIEKRIVNMQKK